MSTDLDEKEKNLFDKIGNPADDDYREKFDPNNSHKIGDEESKASANPEDEDGFNYTGDQDRDTVAEREGVGSSAESDASAAETSDLDNHLGGSWKTSIKGKKSKLKGLLSSKTKVAFAAGGGMTAIGAVAALVLFLIPLTSFMSLQQLSTVLKAKRLANVHYSSYRRMAQYTTQEAFEESPTVRGRLAEKLAKYNPVAGMKNLNEADIFTFNTTEGKTRWTRRPTSTVTSVTIGTETIDIPTTGFGRNRASRAASKAFVAKVDTALAESEVLAGKSRYFRTQVANKLFASREIKLSRWVLGGRKIKTVADAVVSLYESIKPDRLKSSIPDVGESADRFDDGLEDALKGVEQADEVGDNIAELAAKSVKENKIAGAARSVSLAALVGTLYCMGHDYIDQKDEVAKNKGLSAERSAIKLDTAVDQGKHGNTTSTAIDLEANINADFESSYAYQDGVGVDPLVLSQKESDLDESDAPIADTTSPVARIFQATIGTVEGFDPPGPVPPLGSITGVICSALNSKVGIVTTAVVEIVGQIVAAVVSGGTSAAAEGAAKEGLEAGISLTFREAVKKLGAKEASKIAGQEVLKYAKTVASMKAIEFLIFFGVDKLMGTNTPAVDTAQARAAKNDMGYKIFANETGLASGGRPLSGQEFAELRQMDRETRLASLHKKPLWYRLASASNPYSVTSRVAVSYPKSPASLLEKSRNIALGGINPAATLSKSYSGISTALLPAKTAYAAVDEKNDINEYKFQSIGFSKAELDKMLDDEFWPRENAAWMETGNRVTELGEKFGKCFEELTPGEVSIEKRGPECTSESLSTNEALHMRLYLMDGGYANDNENDHKDYKQGVLGQLLDLQTVTAPIGNVGGSIGDDEDPGDNVTPTEDTSNTPCPEGTTDGGVHQDYGPGRSPGIKLRICGIPGHVPTDRGVNAGAAANALLLFKAAKADGLNLGGNAFRSYDAQVALRKQNCPDWQNSRASACSPPTAKAGNSQHEVGLAIDFTNCRSRGTACYQWLAGNASRFGFKNLPSEAWHWSTTGS